MRWRLPPPSPPPSFLCINGTLHSNVALLYFTFPLYFWSRATISFLFFFFFHLETWGLEITELETNKKETFGFWNWFLFDRSASKCNAWLLPAGWLSLISCEWLTLLNTTCLMETLKYKKKEKGKKSPSSKWHRCGAHCSTTLPFLLCPVLHVFCTRAVVSVCFFRIFFLPVQFCVVAHSRGHVSPFINSHVEWNHSGWLERTFIVASLCSWPFYTNMKVYKSLAKDPLCVSGWKPAMTLPLPSPANEWGASC